MKNLILIDTSLITELEYTLIDFLKKKDEQDYIQFKPFLESADRNLISLQIDKLAIKNKSLLIKDILKENTLVYLLNSEDDYCSMNEPILKLVEKHFAMKSYLIEE